MDQDCAKKLAIKVVKEASAMLANPGASQEQKELAFSLVLGIRWTKDLMKTVSAHVINGLVRRGLANPATKELARKLRAGVFEIWGAIGEQLDAESSSWWTFLEERGILDTASRQGWEKVITRLQEWLIFNPKDLSETKWGFMDEVLQNDEHKQLTLRLWLAATAKMTAASDMQRRDISMAEINPNSAFELADRITGTSVNETMMGRASRNAARAAGVEAEEMLKGGPRRKMAKIADKAESYEQIQKFEAMGSRANVMRSCDLSLKSVASGIRCWGSFCELTGRQHFPPTEEAVLAWSAYFGAGRTFQMYLPHLEKACIMMGHSLSWKTRAVTQAAKGLAKAGDRIQEPKPAVSKALFMKIISRNPMNAPFVQAVWVSWIFLLRVQSECLQLVRQMPHEKMDAETILQSPAVIGLEKGQLVIKLHRRKHMAEGSRMVRKCICHKYPTGSLEIHVPQLFCPVCSFWENMRRRVMCGEKLFPGITGSTFTHSLRSMARQFGWEKAEKLGTHSIRRGAARAILAAGGTFAQLLRAGQWHSSAYRLYLDMGGEEAKAMASVLIEDSDEGDEGPP